MKRFALLLFLSLSIFMLSAQTQGDTVAVFEKKQLRKAIRIELYTIDGLKHTGYLAGADTQHVFLARKVVSVDSVSVFDAKEIYQMAAIAQTPYGKRFLNTMVFSLVAMSIAAVAIMSNGEDMMVGPVFIITLPGHLITRWNMLRKTALPLALS